MLGAYESLMKAAPQGIGQPAQSMGGRAMPVGWKEAESASLQHMREISAQMQQIEDMYPDPDMDIHPEHAHRYRSLEADLNQMRQMWEHSMGKSVEQADIKNALEGGRRTRDVTDKAADISAGRISPPPMRR